MTTITTTMTMTTNHQHHDKQQYSYRRRNGRCTSFSLAYTIATSLLLFVVVVVVVVLPSWLGCPVLVEVEAWGSGSKSRSSLPAVSIKNRQGSILNLPITLLCGNKTFNPLALGRSGASSKMTYCRKNIPRIPTLATTKPRTASSSVSTDTNARASILAMMVIASNILIGPPLLPADAYECPSSYSFPELGIQSVIMDNNKITTSASTTSTIVKEKPSLSLSKEKKKTNTPISNNSQQKHCPSNCNENDAEQLQQLTRRKSPFSVQAIVYAPSSMSALLSSSSSSSTTTVLDVTVKSSPSASTLPSKSQTFAGATIPLSQIKSFPITISLGGQNILLLDDDTGSSSSNIGVGDNGDDSNVDVNRRPRDINVPYSDDWAVVATIRHDTNNDGTSNKDLAVCDATATDDVVIQGSGTAKLLMLPMGGDDDQDELLVPVRAAASIRLSASTIPDRLTTW